MPASLPRRASGAPRKPAPSVDEIHARLLGAVIEHRLPPGTRLGEEKLAAVFGVSRTQIRQVLGRLRHQGIVTVVANKGASITAPTVEQAREVFAARRIIEPALVRLVAQSARPADVRKLRQHLRLEQAARAQDDRRAMIRLSGEFHQLIADMAGNSLLARTLHELETLTVLVIILYDSPRSPSCASDEHELLAQAIEQRDPDRAADLMLEHLRHVEHSLDFGLQDGQEVDLQAIFG